MIEAGEMVLERKVAFSLPEERFSKNLDTFEDLLRQEVKKGRAFVGRAIEKALGRRPKPLASFLESARGMNADQIAAVFEAKGLKPEVAQDMAILCRALTSKEGGVKAMEAARRLLAKVKQTGVIPRRALNIVEAGVLAASRASGYQEVAEGWGGISFSGGPERRRPRKEPEDEKEREERERMGKWKGCAVAVLFLCTTCVFGYRIFNTVGDLFWRGEEVKAYVTSHEYYEVLRRSRELKEAGKAMESRKMVTLFRDAVRWMDRVTDGEIDSRNLEARGEWFEEEALPDYRDALGLGWTYTLKKEGYFKGNKIDVNKLRADLEKIYPARIVDKYLKTYLKWAEESANISPISKEESLRRQKLQEKQAKASIQARRLTTKPKSSGGKRGFGKA